MRSHPKMSACWLAILAVFISGVAHAQISGHLTVCRGASRTVLTGTPSGGTWSSGDVARATINASTGEVTGVAAGTAIISYTDPTSAVHTAVVTVNTYVMSAIGFSMGSDVRCTGGATSTCTVSPIIGNNWTTSNASIATINTSGMVTPSATNTGTVIISYRHGYGNCYVTRNMTVTPTPTVSISTPMCAGATQTATATPAGGTWMSSSPAVGTINSTTGVLSALTGGGTGIRYTVGTCFSQPYLTVAAPPAAISGVTTICVGNSSTLSSGTSGGTWSSSNPSVATIGSSTGVVSGLSTGTTTISYIVGSGCFRTAVVTVNTAPSSSAGPDVVCVGQSIVLTNATGGGSWASSNTSRATVTTYGGTVVGVAAGTVNISYRIGGGCATLKTITVNATMASITGGPNVCEGASVSLSHSMSGGTWAASNTNATIDGTTGVMTGVTAGAVNITYTASPGCVKVQMMTVKSTPAAITGVLTVCPGATTALSSASGGGTWTSSNASVATVSSTGVVTGVSGGTATITYTVVSWGCSTTAVVTVSSTSGSISGSTSLCLGTGTTLSSSSIGGTWSSSNTSVATIGSATGVVTSVGTGTTTISYNAGGGCLSTVVLTVSASPSAISGTTGLCVGGSTTLSNSAGGGIWTSSNPSVASIGSSTGILTAVTTGTATITYTSGSCAATVVATVLATPGSITGSTNICAGTTTTLANSLSGGTWTSSNTSVATVGSASGVVSGVAPGTATISYTVGACASSVGMTIIEVPVISGSSLLYLGTTATLSTSVAGGTWTSSNSAVATVGSLSGVLSAVSVGTATITYSLGSGCSDTFAVTASDSVLTILGEATVLIGGTGTLTATAPGGTWSSSAPEVATISSSGVVTGITGGTVVITYTLSPGVFTTLTLSVPFINTTTIGSRMSTIAGTSSPGFTGDGGASASARINGPRYAVTDAAGNIYFSDYANHRVRKISTTGIITTVAGNGTAGYLADGVQATATRLNKPSGLAIDASGNLYVADQGNFRIRKVDGSGVITTIAGTGTAGPFVEGSAATSAKINPFGMTMDGSGNIYFTDDSHRVLKLEASSGNIYRIAGTATPGYGGDGGAATSAQLSSPGYLCLDGSGNLYVSDRDNHRIRKITSSGTISTVAGSGTSGYSGDGGPATSAQLDFPAGIRIDASGNLYIADRANHCLRKVTSAGVISTVAGVGNVADNSGTCGSPLVTRMNNPYDVTLNFVGNPVVLDYGNSRIRVLKDPVTITGPSVVCIGSTATQTSSEVSGRWTSSSTSVATIGSSSGIAAGVAYGTCNVTYTPLNGCALTKVLTVSPTSSSLSVTGSAAVCQNLATTLGATILAGGQWTSSDTTKARVGIISGVVTGVAAGTTIITYEVDNGCLTASATYSMTVNPAPDSIVGTFALCTGSPVSLASTTPDGTWSSSNTAVATIGSSSGVVAGVVNGTSIITYRLPATGCLALQQVSVTLTPVSSYYLAGQYAIRHNYHYGITLVDSFRDVTGLSGTWSLSDSSVVSVTSVYPHFIGGFGTSAGTVTISYAVANSCGSYTYTRGLVVEPEVCDNVWSAVGKGQTGDFLGGGDHKTCITVDRFGIPMVSFMDGLYTPGQKHYIRRYDGKGFERLKVADVDWGPPPVYGDYTYVFADSAGTPYHVFHGYSDAQFYKWTGGDWVFATSIAAHPVSVCAGSGNSFYVAFSDPVHSYKATVARYNGSAWDTIGVPGFTSSPILTMPDIFTSVSGVPYIAYLRSVGASEDSVGLEVMKYNGSAWVPVGGLVAAGAYYPEYFTGPVTVRTDVAGLPYVSYSGSPGSPNAHVSRYNGATWESLGSSAAISAGEVQQLSLAVDPSGSPYVSFKDLANGGKATVKKYSGGSWSAVGAVGFTAPVTATSIAIDNAGTPYLSCVEDYFNAGRVYKFNGAGWERMNMGAAITNLPGHPEKKLVMDGDTAYFAYVAGRIGVRKLVGDTWTTLGSDTFSASSPSSLSMAVKGGTVFVAYRDPSVSGKATVMKYNGSGWSALGGLGISAGAASTTDIAVDSSGTPYLVYSDAANGNKATVLRHNGSAWVAVGSAGFTPGGTSATSIAINNSGQPFVSFSDSAQGAKAAVMKYNGSAWVYVGGAFSHPRLLVSDTITYPTNAPVMDTWIEIDGSGIPYVAYRTTSFALFVRKFDGVNWVSLRPGPDYDVISSSPTTNYSFAVSDSGVAYLASSGNVSSGGTDIDACRVFVFNGYDWMSVGSQVFGQEFGYTSLASLAIYPELAIGSNGTPYLAHAHYDTWSSGPDYPDTRPVVKKLGHNTIAGLLSVCQGSRTYLTAERKSYQVNYTPDYFSNFVVGAWSSSNTSVATVDTYGTVTGISAGTAMISYQYGDCPVYVVVTVNAPVSAGTLSGSSSVAVGSSITLSSSVSGGIWSSSSMANATVGSSSGSVTGVAPGTVTITYAVAGACGLAIATRTVNVTSARPAVTGGAGVDGAFFSAYPNPASGSISIESGATGTLSVYTIDGKELKHYDVIKGVTALQLPSGLAAGIYMLRFKADDGSTHTLRLVYEP